MVMPQPARGERQHRGLAANVDKIIHRGYHELGEPCRQHHNLSANVDKERGASLAGNLHDGVGRGAIELVHCHGAGGAE
jgi:hypothetical protein